MPLHLPTWKLRKNCTILLVVVAILFVVAGHAQITPSDDAYVNSASPTTNYGTAATLNLASPTQTPYIRFDFSAVPPSYTGSQVAKATLKLFVNSVTTAGSFNLDVVNGSWSEHSLTYNLQPALGITIASSVPLTTSNKAEYIQIDVTSTVQAWLNGSEPNDGLALVANSPLVASFTTKESTTTSHPPEIDIVFLGSGAQGPPGPAGPQGLQGSQGPIGLTGGIGPAGPQGPAGSVGVVNRGTWSPVTQYQDNDTVSYNGSSWIALLPNLDSAPNATNPNWQLLAAKGINNQGSWVQTINYQVDDAVTDGGQFWLAIAPNTGSEPSLLNPNWQLIAAQGAQGSAGPAGPQGPQGAQGIPGPAGQQGAVGPQGPLGPLGPIGPVGPAGPQGNPGSAGPVGITNRGAWTAGTSYNANDAVTDQGQYWLATGSTDGVEPGSPGSTVWLLIASKGADGAVGPAGPPGPMGPAGPSGPAGPVGSQGPPGAVGATGPAGTGILNGTQDFTSGGTWTAPAGVTRVIAELWGGGGGGGNCGGNTYCSFAGQGGGAGAYARSVLAVTPGNTYTILIGAGGPNNVDGTPTQFLDSTNTVLLQAGGGVQGTDASDTKTCNAHLTPPLACGSGGTPGSGAQIGHTGAAGVTPTSDTCLPSGGTGYATSGFSSTVGGGGSGVYGTIYCSAPPSTTGQNGYALLTW